MAASFQAVGDVDVKVSVAYSAQFFQSYSPGWDCFYHKDLHRVV